MRRLRTLILAPAATLATAAAAALLAVVAAAGAPRAAVAAADPFYIDLFRDGVQSYARADYAAAAKLLRLACFGMLDDPDQLAGCLTRLAVAQAAAGNADTFRDTFRRIVEVEDRFGAYSRTDLPTDIRDAFEQKALALVPAAALVAIPQFKDLLNRKAEAQLAALPPRERRKALEEHLAKEPKSVTWNAMMAELDLSEGRNAAAATRAEQMVAAAPQDARALCLRGLTRAAANRCKEALADFDSCFLCAREPRYAAAQLGCRITQGEWARAEEQVEALPAAWKDDRQLAVLVQQVHRHNAAASGNNGSNGSNGNASGAAGAAPARGGRTGGGAAGTTGGAAAGGPTGRGGGGAAAGTATPGAATPVTGAPAAGGAPGTPGKPAGGSNAAAAGASGTNGANAAGSAAPAGPGSSPSGATSGSRPAIGGAGASGAPAAAGAVPASPLSAAERDTMARAAGLLTAADSQSLKEAMRLARQVADSHPDSRDAQHLAGEAAYRNARWLDAAAYFRRGGLPGDDHPELQFYMAVALYQVGDQAGAAAAMRRALPNLEKTPYVQSYVKRILGQ